MTYGTCYVCNCLRLLSFSVIQLMVSECNVRSGTVKCGGDRTHSALHVHFDESCSRSSRPSYCGLCRCCWPYTLFVARTSILLLYVHRQLLDRRFSVRRGCVCVCENDAAMPRDCENPTLWLYFLIFGWAMAKSRTCNDWKGWSIFRSARRFDNSGCYFKLFHYFISNPNPKFYLPSSSGSLTTGSNVYFYAKRRPEVAHAG